MKPERTALDTARRKIFLRLLPLVFLGYVVAYVDRTNVAIAKLTMAKDLPAFDNGVIGFGAGLFFLGYFLLEIPGAIIVERWSARRWLSRIMITWGVIAAMTAFVTTPAQFYGVRFLLGLGEAGFFPGIIVYLTHWFPARDRARAFSLFVIAAPVAQLISPKISNALLALGTQEWVDGVLVQHATVFGLKGWQVMYIFWGIPAVVLGFVFLLYLVDKPRQARWLTAEEREALETALEADRAERRGSSHMGLLSGLRHPKVLLLTAIYFLYNTANYGFELFLPSILERWYGLKLDALTWFVLLPPAGLLVGQLLIGASSDRTGERRLHTALPMLLGAVALALTPLSRGSFALTMGLLVLAMVGLRAHLPAFWALPGLFLSDVAAAGAVGLINAVGNLGGFLGPYTMGRLEVMTGSFEGGIAVLAGAIAAASFLVFALRLDVSSRPPRVRPATLAPVTETSAG